MGIEAESPLWRFALDAYGRPGAAQACLDLQERRDQDVCLLLFGLWAGAACGYRLSAADLATLHGAVDSWHGEIVRSLRAIRKRLKSGPHPAPDAATAALRARVQAIEIEAERIELATLAAALPLEERPLAPDEATSAALANLALICPPETPEDRAAIRVLAGL